MNTLKVVIEKIISRQQMIIGPLALDQAGKVNGIKIGGDGKIIIKGDSNLVITNLVNEYAKLFGNASIEVCRDAIREINPPISTNDLPDILK